VLSRDEQLSPVEPDKRFPWLHALPGSTAIARSAVSPTWLVSVHLHSRRISADLLNRLPIDGIEITTRDGSLWESNVVPHELQRLFADETFLWGGDLNCDPRMDGLSGGYAGGNQRVFDIWRDAGSIDTRAPFHTEFQQTFFRARQRVPFQLDHVFVDARTEGRLQAWEVDTGPASNPDALSDHAPIIVTLTDDSPVKAGPTSR
jgi:endonuclease/exonuclease/phosphatase family metal-dependent hydrolase